MAGLVEGEAIAVLPAVERGARRAVGVQQIQARPAALGERARRGEMEALDVGAVDGVGAALGAQRWWCSSKSASITTSLYFIVFGSAIGSRMNEVGGVSYGAFIVPGLMMLSLFTQSIFNASFGIHFPKFIGTIYELLSAPISYLESFSPTSARRQPNRSSWV